MKLRLDVLLLLRAPLLETKAFLLLGEHFCLTLSAAAGFHCLGGLGAPPFQPPACSLSPVQPGGSELQELW